MTIAQKEFYGRRQGRALKKHKAELMAELLPKRLIVIDENGNLSDDFLSILKQNQKVQLEIGFGNGEHLAALALRNPDCLFIGCEPFRNGIANLLALMERDNIENIYIFNEDARLLLRALPDNCIDQIYVLFADPWPKARHAKRRFISENTLSLMQRIMKDKAILQTASDHPIMIEWLKEQFSLCKFFKTIYQGYEEPLDWIETKYQRKAVKEGRQCFFMNCISI